MVSSRSKTAAEAAVNKRTTRSAVAAGTSPQVPDISITELDTKSTGRKASGASAKKSVTKAASSKSPISTTSSSAKSMAKSKKRGGGTYCVCNGEDDGSPMIKCEGECQNWYHFECVDLDEDVAGEIEKYYCPGCEKKTGLKTVMDFEGPDAFVAPAPTPSTTVKKERNKTPLPVEEIDVVDTPEESEGAGSEDDYIAEPTGKRARSGKRTTRRLSFSSDKTDSDDVDDESNSGRRRHASRGGRLKRLKKAPTSPTSESNSALKRRGSSAQHPAAKRSKTAESAHDDAIRAYCLTKLEEIIRPMFEEYREAQVSSQTQDQPDVEQSGDNKEPTVPSSNTEEEKNVIDQKVKSFVNELEHCMMETYAEPDKTGKPSAGGKYKERFRMLQFNLPKKDRVVLRRGIASGRITPAQLNVMSSTDLADEQTKHDIEIAEKESLEHSILQKITAPRAKITHKGFETIEDFSGQRAADAAKEEEEQRMRMEKLEREKLARMRSLSLRSPTTTEHPSPMSATFPKANSPTVASVPHSQQPWAVPLPPSAQISQAQHDTVPPASPSTNRPYVRPLFVPSMSTDNSTSEESLSLADLINIDGDIPTQDGPQSNPQQRMSAQANVDVGSSSSPVITTPSGPSPFAPSRPAESASRASFDLSSLWTGPETDRELDKEAEDKRPDAGGDYVAAGETMEEVQEDAMELESDGEDDDRALDAIFKQGAITEGAQGTEAPAPQPDSLPEVWSGQITMPRENSDALTIDVTCKQIAGRTLESMSGYWQTLFPSPQARIDGRVPTAQSIKYLVSIRMNSSKELIVVNFAPRSDEALVKFNELINFLIGKDRHALVFPWGTQPRPQAPGREFYIVPLLKDHPLPEFIELMDDHRLPKERTENLLLGVFVLNKGKLVATAPPSGAASAPAPVPTPYPPIPNQYFQMPSIPPIPPIPSGLPSSHSPSPVAPPPAKINQQALAAEVASLTPEQISFMLRHLTQSAPLAASAVGSAVASGPAAPPPAPSPYPPPIPGMPLFPPQFSPSHQQQMQAPPIPQSYSPPRHQGQFGDYHYDERDDWADGQRGRGSRGRGNDRGRRGFRGRGKSFQDDRNNRPPPADRGWGGRGRGAPPR